MCLFSNGLTHNEGGFEKISYSQMENSGGNDLRFATMIVSDAHLMSSGDALSYVIFENIGYCIARKLICEQ
jgi:hypothetical protein